MPSKRDVERKLGGRPRITLVVTDLDNTLFDWVSIWHSGFDAQLRALIRLTGVDRTRLLDDFRTVHQRYGTSEYAFALEELSLLDHRADAAGLRDAARTAANSARAAKEKPYPTVLPTLKKLRDVGTLVVGYTDSMPLYTLARLSKLGLDGLLDYVFTPPGHPVPVTRNGSDIRYTKHCLTPPGEVKPNPKVLLDIIASVGGKPSETVYVGDSLMKDMAMAQQAKVTDVWAKYGVAQDRVEYELLRAVTHWQQSGVEKEKGFIPPKSPRFVLEESFSELLELFSFARGGIGPAPNNQPRRRFPEARTGA